MADRRVRRISRSEDSKHDRQVSGQPTRRISIGYSRDFDASYKVLLVGDSGVGKTALIKKLMGHQFNPDHRTTIGEIFSHHLKRHLRLYVHIIYIMFINKVILPS